MCRLFLGTLGVATVVLLGLGFWTGYFVFGPSRQDRIRRIPDRVSLGLVAVVLGCVLLLALLRC
jgi:hypothetical protein